MRNLPSPAVRGATLTAALLLLAGCAGEPVVESLRFAPPEGSRWRLTSEHRESIRLPGFAQGDQRSRTKSHVLVRRASAWAFAWEEELEELRYTIDGRDPFPGLSDDAKGLALVTELMEDGEVTALRGVERLEALLAQRAAAAGLAPGSASISVWDLRERERAAWDERVRMLAGQPLRLGETIEGPNTLDLGDGNTVGYLVRVTPRELAPCGAAQCVKLVVEYAADPDEVTRYVGRPVSELLRGADDALVALTIGNLDVTGGGERLVEVATLLVRREKVERKLRLTVRSPAEPLELVFTIADDLTLEPAG